jgi:thiosulfate/3-mercaptopyruvate sulfurtransferase
MNTLFLTLLVAGLAGGIDQNVVSTAWLEQNLDDPSVVIVEIGKSATIDNPRIPGARFVAIESIVKGDGWPPDELLSVEEMDRAFEEAGVGDEGRIILYSMTPLYTTRAWFTLDYLGHGHRAAILDGGLNRWMAEKRPVTDKRPHHLAKTFTPNPDPARLIAHANVRSAGSGAILLDARSEREFNGFVRGRSVVRRGHIPGALNAPWQMNLTGKGEFRSAAELRDAYEKLVGKTDDRVIVYCRTGMEATMPYFVLRSMGYNVVLFDGSYAEWARDKSVPVAKLSAKP